MDHTLRKVPTREVPWILPPKATYELVVDGTPLAWIEKYVDPNGRCVTRKGARFVKYVPVTYWAYEGLKGENDQQGYETRALAVENALRDLLKEE